MANLKFLSTKFQLLWDKYVAGLRHDLGLFYMADRLNFGDVITPEILRMSSGLVLPHVNPLRSSGPTIFSIGSILKYANSDSLVWGSGFISELDSCKQMPKKVFSVRGPRTGEILKSKYGISVQRYGDPALLLADYYKPDPSIDIAYDIGIIPHYADKEALQRQIKSLSGLRFRIINIETDDIQGFIDSIASCSCIYSSTLHGIIVSESLGVPARWIELSNLVFGNGFKFFDYYESTGRFNVEPIQLSKIESFHLDELAQNKLTNSIEVLKLSLRDSLEDLRKWIAEH